MTGSQWLDIALFALAAAAAISGWINGAAASGFALLGVAIGATSGLLVAPHLVREVDSPLGPVSLVEPPRYTDPSAEVAAGSLLAPMPGSVIRVAVSVGDTVTAGQPLLWMEAMKMEHTIAAAVDGVVTDLPVEVGTQVESGTILAVVSDTDTATDTQTEQEWSR